MTHDDREDLRLLASYAEGTVGSVMTSAYVTLRPTQTVHQTLANIRLEAPDVETIYLAYVVDDQRRILGTVSLRRLILAPPHQRSDAMMTRESVCRQRHATNAN